MPGTAQKPHQGTAGFSLIGLALMLMVLGVTLSTTLLFLLPDLERNARAKTVAHLRADKNALIGYALAHGHLPAPEQFDTVVPQALDGYQNPIQYAVDERLTARQALCRHDTTRLAVEERHNVALVIWSPGRNGRINQVAAQPDKIPGRVATATRIPNPPYSAQGTPDDSSDDLDDLLAWVTLDELRSRTGCEKAEEPILTIATDGMPIGFEGQRYGTVTFSAWEGGDSTAVQWCVESAALMKDGPWYDHLRFTPPEAVTVRADGQCRTPESFTTSAVPVLHLTGSAPFDAGDGQGGKSYPLRLFLQDQTGRSVNRLFRMTIKPALASGETPVRLTGSSRLSSAPAGIDNNPPSPKPPAPDTP
ncbi:MAG: hypothetical protein HQL91_06625 [Magnetococcales bacterium]|nr:hypothetical protein [Magnetococcales bacterium]